MALRRINNEWMRQQVTGGAGLSPGPHRHTTTGYYLIIDLNTGENYPVNT